MNPIKTLTAFIATLALLATLGYAGTRTHEATGQYVDDSVITAKVKAAVLGEPELQETYLRVIENAQQTVVRAVAGQLCWLFGPRLVLDPGR